MKKRFSRTVGLTARLLLLAVSSAVQAQFLYWTNDGTITITGYTGPGGDVTVPSTINGLPVTTVGESAFQGRTDLISLTLPDSIASLAVYAFESCRNLTSVTIP